MRQCVHTAQKTKLWCKKPVSSRARAPVPGPHALPAPVVLVLACLSRHILSVYAFPSALDWTHLPTGRAPLPARHPLGPGVGAPLASWVLCTHQPSWHTQCPHMKSPWRLQ